MIIHYNCTIGSILLHFFLLICHPYPSSFHEMIFILVCVDTGIVDCKCYSAINRLTDALRRMI